MRSYKITKIKITEGKGAFAEWANSAEGQTEEDIERWQSAYYAEIVLGMGEIFPGTKISIEEGSAQNVNRPIDVIIAFAKTETEDTIEADDEWDAQFKADELVRQYFDDVSSQVSTKGTFWA